MPSPSCVLSLQRWWPHRDAVGCWSQQICTLSLSQLTIRLLLSGLPLVLHLQWRMGHHLQTKMPVSPIRTSPEVYFKLFSRLLKRSVFLPCAPLLGLRLAPRPTHRPPGWGLLPISCRQPEERGWWGCGGNGLAGRTWSAAGEGQVLPQLLQGCSWGCPSPLDSGVVVGLGHLQRLLLRPGKSQKV